MLLTALALLAHPAASSQLALCMLAKLAMLAACLPACCLPLAMLAMLAACQASRQASKHASNTNSAARAVVHRTGGCMLLLLLLLKPLETGLHARICCSTRAIPGQKHSQT